MLAAAEIPPAYAFSTAPLTIVQRHRLNGSSWHPGCPVALDGLRHVRLSYVGFDGAVDRGRQHLGLHLPPGDRRDALVAARLRPCRRRQHHREPRRVRRWQHDPRGVAAVPRPLAAPQGHGLRRRLPGARVPQCRLGWGGSWPGPTDYQHFSANGT